MGKIKNAASQIDDKQFDKMSVLISSMTEEERKKPDLIAKLFKTKTKKLLVVLGMQLQI